MRGSGPACGRGAVLAAVLALGAVRFASAAPGHCQIEIVNRSHHDVSVAGTFDDGSALPAFRMTANDMPHYIDLFYHGYCHSAMHLRVASIHVPHSTVIYDAWTHTGSTIHVSPY